MSEAIRLIRERLVDTDPLALELLARDPKLKLRLLNEAVGPLYHDFKRHIQWDANWGVLDTAASASNWIPPRERPVIYASEDDLDDDG